MHKRVVSVEREFLLYGKVDGRPACGARRQKVQRELSRMKIDNAREVADNVIEVKVPFINGDAGDRLWRAFSTLYGIANAEGLYVVPVSSPERVPVRSDAFFSTLAFPSLSSMSQTASMHVHIAVDDERDMLGLYDRLNAISGLMLRMSGAIIGGEHVRAKRLAEAFSQLPHLITEPMALASLDDYHYYMRIAGELVDRSLPEDVRERLIEKYPDMFREGRIRTITPDKVFTFVRIRPDLCNCSHFGSVEFRAFDGQPTFARDLIITEGMQGIDSGLNGLGSLSPVHIRYDVEALHTRYEASLVEWAQCGPARGGEGSV